MQSINLFEPSENPVNELSPILKKVKDLKHVLNQIILGKANVIEQIIVVLLAQGHILLEDIPGIGKTTLAKAFALTLDCGFSRVQFTPDLLPSDVIGTSIYHPADQKFHFQKGPIFTQILMADEINRASPRTQSSLLEAMAERQVTVDGKKLTLGPPFLVIATQNPLEYQGTYPLPEAQLDRFMIRLELGYPDTVHELDMLMNQEKQIQLKDINPLLNLSDLLQLQNAVNVIHFEKDLAVYLMHIIKATREHESIELGVSPRGSLALYQAAKARALLHDRDYVLPEDLKALAAPVLAHRMILKSQAAFQGVKKVHLLNEILALTPAP